MASAATRASVHASPKRAGSCCVAGKRGHDGGTHGHALSMAEGLQLFLRISSGGNMR